MIGTRSELEEKLAAREELSVDIDGLLRLYREDRDTFYSLACIGVGDAAAPLHKAMASAASRLMSALHSNCSVHANASGIGGELVCASWTLPYQNLTITDVQQFLQELDGVSEGREAGRGRDYSGTPATAAEVQFRLGESRTWQASRKRFESRIAERPMVLRLSDEDRAAVTSGMPAYIAYELMNCATKTVAAPTVVFEGIRNQGPLKKGTAYCGLPNRAYDNRGIGAVSPDGMVYLVFADAEGYVFDWDWVKEDPSQRGYPAGFRERFNRIIQVPRDAVLDTGLVVPNAFTPHQAWYSNRGKCVFVYFSDTPAFAERVNDDVTVFLTFGKPEVVGCKIKNIERKRVEEEPRVMDLLAESLMRQIKADIIPVGYGKLFSSVEDTMPTVVVPKPNGKSKVTA